MIWIWIILATIASAILYRLGGASKQDAKKEFPWVPMWFINLPKKRDVGCGLVTGSLLWFVIFPRLGMASPWWIHLLAFGALWGALSTYWDWLCKPEWDNFWLHGFMCGIAYMWLGWHNPSLWLWLGIRSIVMAIFMGVWCHILFSDAKAEELGRGGIIPLSLGLLLLI